MRWSVLALVVTSSRALAGLIPTPAEDHARYQAVRAAEIAHLVEALPGVREARVLLDLPPAATTAWPPLDGRAAAPGSAAVVLVLEPGAPAPAGVQELVSASASVAAVHLEIVHAEARPPAAAALAHVGPFAVAPGSRAALQWTLAGAALAVLVMAGLVIALVLRRRAGRTS